MNHHFWCYIWILTQPHNARKMHATLHIKIMQRLSVVSWMPRGQKQPLGFHQGNVLALSTRPIVAQLANDLLHHPRLVSRPSQYQHPPPEVTSTRCTGLSRRAFPATLRDVIDFRFCVVDQQMDKAIGQVTSLGN